MKKSVYIITLILCLPGCFFKQKKSVGFALNTNPNYKRIREDVLPPEDKPITIFIHGGAKPLSSILAFPGLQSCCPAGMHLTKTLGCECVLGKKVAAILSRSSPYQFPISAFYNFGWSGFLSYPVREHAGQELYESLVQLKSDPRHANTPITVIAYSHGGNVVLNCGITAQARKDNRVLIDKLVLLACPVVIPTEHWVTSPTFGKVIALYSKSDAFQALDPQGIYEALSGVRRISLFSKHYFEDMPQLFQAELKINNRSRIGHLGFMCKSVLNALPRILDFIESPEEVKKLPRDENQSYCISLNTRNSEIAACKTLLPLMRSKKKNKSFIT